LATLEQCHRLCGVSQPELTTLEWSQMSDDHFGVSFVQFDEEMKHQMP
jgi:hypothetical protein